MCSRVVVQKHQHILFKLSWRRFVLYNHTPLYFINFKKKILSKCTPKAQKDNTKTVPNCTKK